MVNSNLEKYEFGQISPDEKISKEVADKAINKIQRVKLGSVEKSTEKQLEANNKRVLIILEQLWGKNGKISMYQQSFDTPNKVREILPEIENYIAALEDSESSVSEFNGKTTLETLQKLTLIRDHIKLILLKVE